MKVLITGNQRSGTTLLQMIVSSFHNVYMHPEELNPFGFKPKHNKKILSIKCPQGQHIKEQDRHKGDFISKTGIKTIGDILNNDWKIIYIIRDGRDVCVSTHGLNKEIYWAKPWQWIYSYNNSKKYYNHNNLLFVKYEDLAINHSLVIQKISKFINDKQNNYNSAYKKFSKNTQVKQAVKTLRPIDDNSIDNWRNKKHINRITEILLSKYKEDFCKSLCELGYEKDDSWTTEFI